MRFRWRERVVSQADVVARLQSELNSLAEPLARLLVLRGISTLEEARLFFRGSLSDLHDPFLMAGMEAAASRVAQAIQSREPVLVFGDYDVDGVTSTALMVSFLREMEVPVSYHVPDRIEEGYGLNRGAIDRAVERGARLLISLDCGITAHDEAAYARERGVDLIVCDHHTPGESIPEAFAVLDPKRGDCGYPFKELSGCGVGFKLIQAVLDRMNLAPDLAYAYLDLVAISAASDIVPVTGENRVLMREGFRLIDEKPRPGLSALAARAELALSPCNSGRIVFGVGPRLNAAGRMSGASKAVELLLAPTIDAAAPIAAELERINSVRRDLDEAILGEAAAEAERAMPRSGLVLYRPDWHPGVIGIVASRIV
ncbi:MAG TPA: DHH family phosphoesterase, partial [Rhodothermales bacterium]